MPEGRRIADIYADFIDVPGEANGKIVARIISHPPQGKYLVKNIYFDPVTGKLEVEYDDTPAP